MTESPQVGSTGVSFDGWIPSHFWLRPGATHASAPVPEVQWTLLGPTLLRDPFFEQTMQREKSRPFQHLFRRDSTVDEMLRWVEASPPAPLRGMIFHMSRCGSTLISQMLAAAAHNIVLSEPAPLDSTVHAAVALPGLSRETHLAWIRGMVGALGQRRSGSEDALYLKLDSWHIHHLDLLREAFPQVPFLFVYREPIEVMVSHARLPALWTIPGMPHPAGSYLDQAQQDLTQPLLYCARVLASMCEAALKSVVPNGGLLVNYSELPRAMFHRIHQHFHLPAEDMAVMAMQSMQDAKAPQRSFAGDAEEKRASAEPDLHRVTETLLRPLYQRLEEAQREQASLTKAGSY